MENGVQRAAGTAERMGLGWRFAAFSQEILDRYAIWENYPWNDAVIQFLQMAEEEGVPKKEEPTSFFVTVELLKLYLEKGRREQKIERGLEEPGDEELIRRIEEELGRLQAQYDRCFGILERLYREGRQMPREELAGIWTAIERESGRRTQQEHVQRIRGGKVSHGSERGESAHRRITPLSLGGPWIRFRRLTEGHSRIPDGKELFYASVQRQQREFYSKIVREYVVQETERQARNRLGRELRPFERQALADYGASLGRAELAYYAAGFDRESLYQETAAVVLGRLEKIGSRQGIHSWETLRQIPDQTEPEDAGAQPMETKIFSKFQAVQDAAFWQRLCAEGRVYREESRREEEIRSLLSSLPDSVSRIAAEEALGHLSGAEDRKREALNRTIHSLPETREALIFKSQERESWETLSGHTALHPVHRPGAEKKIRDAETHCIEMRPGQPALPQNRLTQPEDRAGMQGQDKLPGFERRETGCGPAERESGRKLAGRETEPGSGGWTGSRGAGQNAGIAEKFKTADRPLHLLPLGYGADLVYHMGTSGFSQEPGTVLRPAGKSGSQGQAAGARREKFLLSEVWEQASSEEKRELLRHIPRAVEQALRRIPDLKANGARTEKREELWNQSERSHQSFPRENPEKAGKPAGGAELVPEESETFGRNLSGQEPIRPLSASRERGRIRRQSIFAEALVWLVPQTGTRRYADGEDIMGEAKKGGGREIPNSLNVREISGIPDNREIRVSPEFLKMFWSLESRKKLERSGSRGNTENGKPPGVLQAPRSSPLPEYSLSSPFSYPELSAAGIVYIQKEPAVPAASQKERDTQDFQELETRITRQEYIIRQERIERGELERRLKKQESWLADSQSGTGGKFSVRPNGQLSQKVVDQLKEQLRLDRIRYGAD